jgi:hypothetical protein
VTASLFKPVCLLMLTLLLAGCATSYESEKSFWNGQTGFSQTRLGPDKWQLEFVGNDLVDRETARKYVLKRAGELALAEGYSWLGVDELTITRDAVRVTPSRPIFGFDEDEPDLFMAQMHVQHRISALLTFRLLPRALNERNESKGYTTFSERYRSRGKSSR